MMWRELGILCGCKQYSSRRWGQACGLVAQAVEAARAGRQRPLPMTGVTPGLPCLAPRQQEHKQHTLAEHLIYSHRQKHQTTKRHTSPAPFDLFVSFHSDHKTNGKGAQRPAREFPRCRASISQTTTAMRRSTRGVFLYQRPLAQERRLSAAYLTAV